MGVTLTDRMDPGFQNKAWHCFTGPAEVLQPVTYCVKQHYKFCNCRQGWHVFQTRDSYLKFQWHLPLSLRSIYHSCSAGGHHSPCATCTWPSCTRVADGMRLHQDQTQHSSAALQSKPLACLGSSYLHKNRNAAHGCLYVTEQLRECSLDGCRMWLYSCYVC